MIFDYRQFKLDFRRLDFYDNREWIDMEPDEALNYLKEKY